jgi:kynurenine formamidase
MRESTMPAFIDLTMPITDSMPVFPGDEPPRIHQANEFERDGFNIFHVSMNMHTGTHIDGPMHLTRSERFINDIPLNQYIGRGCILNAAGKKHILPTAEYESLVHPQSIVLLYTGMSRLFGTKEYYDDFPVMSSEFAHLCIERQIKMVCLDSPSPDRHPFEIHKLLLENSVLIAENLTSLDKLLSVHEFEVLALPLNIHADSSPARIIARTLE